MHHLHFQTSQVPLLTFYLLFGITKLNPASEPTFLGVLLIYKIYFKTRTALLLMCLLTFGNNSLQVSATPLHSRLSDTLIHSSVCRYCGNRLVAVVWKPHICLLCGLSTLCLVSQLSFVLELLGAGSILSMCSHGDVNSSLVLVLRNLSNFKHFKYWSSKCHSISTRNWAILCSGLSLDV